MMLSKAPLIASVKISDPATKATPRTIAKALSSSRSLRATRLRHVTLSIGSGSAARAGARSSVAGELRHAFEDELRVRVVQLPDDAPVGEEDDPVGVARGDGVVRDHHHRLAELVDGALQQREHLRAGAAVEVA